MKGFLVLEDGEVYVGTTIGAPNEVWGEVVFHTAVTGYQDIITDPAYLGQIVVLTYPLVGNYGIDPTELVEKRPHVRGLVVKEFCVFPHNWRSQESLASFLRRSGVVGLQGLDTRALTRHLRDKGPMRGIITRNIDNLAAVLARLRSLPTIEEQDLVDEVATKQPYVAQEGTRQINVIGLGGAAEILATLRDFPVGVTVFPPAFPVEEVVRNNPLLTVISNGPGAPQAAPIGDLTQILSKTPLFGVGLGHQLLAMAAGAKVVKMAQGHRGHNLPVKEEGGRVFISRQSHGYVGEEESVGGTDLASTHRNLNDGTIEGLRQRRLPIASVQYRLPLGPMAPKEENPLTRWLHELGISS